MSNPPSPSRHRSPSRRRPEDYTKEMIQNEIGELKARMEQQSNKRVKEATTTRPSRCDEKPKRM